MSGQKQVTFTLCTPCLSVLCHPTRLSCLSSVPAPVVSESVHAQSSAVCRSGFVVPRVPQAALEADAVIVVENITSNEHLLSHPPPLRRATPSEGQKQCLCLSGSGTRRHVALCDLISFKALLPTLYDQAVQLNHWCSLSSFVFPCSCPPRQLLGSVVRSLRRPAHRGADAPLQGWLLGGQRSGQLGELPRHLLNTADKLEYPDVQHLRRGLPGLPEDYSEISLQNYRCPRHQPNLSLSLVLSLAPLGGTVRTQPGNCSCSKTGASCCAFITFYTRRKKRINTQVTPLTTSSLPTPLCSHIFLHSLPFSAFLIGLEWRG